jgi:hypothetical protein
VLAATTLQAMATKGEQPTKKRVTQAVATVAERLRTHRPFAGSATSIPPC